MSICDNCEVIELLPPTFDDALKTSEAIAKRRSCREYNSAKGDKQNLSNLCYFSAGITDEKNALTANPTANNRQQIDLYLVSACGVFRYDPKKHVLLRIADGDHRAITGNQDFVAEATYNFIYVTNGEKFAAVTDPEKRVFYSGTDSAFMAHNTCLIARSMGLDSIVRAAIDRKAIHSLLKLQPLDMVSLATSVGLAK